MFLFSVIFFAVAVNLFLGMEIYLNVRERDRTDASQDANSLRTIGYLRNAAFVIGAAAAFFPVVPLPGGRSAHLIAGGVVVLMSFLIRGWAIVRLGNYFTNVVMTQEDQKIVTDGPYKYVRHPAYTGALLFFCGLGTATGSLPGLVLMVALIFYAFRNRMLVEERVMASEFGEEYIDYMARTKRIIPLVY